MRLILTLILGGWVAGSETRGEEEREDLFLEFLDDDDDDEGCGCFDIFEDFEVFEETCDADDWFD